MDKELKVAFLGTYTISYYYLFIKTNTTFIVGVKPHDEEWISEVGLRTYTMKVETAMDVIQYSHKGRLSNDVVPGLPTPEKELLVMAGGRMMMFFQREVSFIIKMNIYHKIMHFYRKSKIF